MNVLDIIEKKALTNFQTNIVIAGITCSGKTTLANNIKNYFEQNYSVTIIGQDNYFKNICDIPKSPNGYLTDSINAFHANEFRLSVKELLQCGITTIPTYDISSNLRVCKNTTLHVGNINIFEGLHTISLLSDLDNCIKIFVNTDISICLERRIQRDSKTFNIPKTRIIEYWNDCIMPMCNEHIFPQKQMADIILN